MSIRDEAEWLELNVDTGQVTTEDAVHRMIQYSEGGLTRAGAADLVSGDERRRRDHPMVEMREFTPREESDHG